MNRQAISALLLAAFAALLTSGGCSQSKSASSGSTSEGGPPKTRIAIVTDTGGLGDKSFNDSAYAGLKEAQARLGVEGQVLQSKSAADYQPNLSVLANEDVDGIIAIGFLLSKDLTRIASTYPHNHFAIVDAVVDAPNVASVTFREQEGAFLAGALAALVSKTRTVAFLGGMDFPLLRKFEAGFTAGAHEVDPNVHVLVKYVGSFDDVAAGKELAGVLFDDRADVVFAAAGKAGLGAIDEVRGRDGAFVIGVDANQDGIAPGKILTSMVKRVDVAVYRIAKAAVERKFVAGHNELGLKDGAISLTDMKYTKDAVGAANLAKVARIERAIVTGKIVPPSTREELATFKPVAL
jgi:basic membrane protein A